MSDNNHTSVQLQMNPYGGTIPTWTYGNWGGKGWSAGKFTPPGERPDFEKVPGLTPLDEVFKTHDQNYWKAEIAWNASAKSPADIANYWNSIISADKQMRAGIQDLKLNNGWGETVPGVDTPNFNIANAALQADRAFAVKGIYNDLALKNGTLPGEIPSSSEGIQGDPSTGLFWPGADQVTGSSELVAEIIITAKRESTTSAITAPNDAPTRNSASFITDSSANDHLVVIKTGGTVWDAFAAQKNDATGFKNWDDFKAAVAASNPAITDLNNIGGGTTLYLPEKLSDGSVTYHYAGGTSINCNPITGEYHMVVLNADGLGGYMVYSRTKSDTETGWDITSKLYRLFDGVSLIAGVNDALIDQLQKLQASAATIDPLVLDLDGDGVETTALSKSISKGVHFNLNAKGLSENTGWVGKDDGLLVRDIDNDGRITSGLELFGDHTLLKNGQLAANGFEALKDLDSNGDGLLDSKDSSFGTMLVWKDSNSDGLTDAGELLSLSQAGVSSLKVGYYNSGMTDSQGNIHQQLGSFTTTSGATRAMNDVWLRIDAARSVDQNTVGISAEIAALPELEGLGNVRSLHQAMARDATGQLKLLVQQWKIGSSVQRSAVQEQLIYSWAGVQGVDPKSRGNYIDARKLAAVEAFLGSDFTRNMGNPSNAAIAQPLQQAFSQLAQSIVEQLYWQTDAIPLIGNISLVWVAPEASAAADKEAAKGHFGYKADALVKALYDQFSGKTLSDGSQELILFTSVLKKNGADAALEALKADSASYDGLFKTILQSKGDSVTLGMNGVQLGTYGADRINTSSTGATILLGMDGDDVLLGAAQAEYIDGGSGNDSLSGYAGDDTIAGGASSDFLDGGYGSDTYIFNMGDGSDILSEYDYNSGNVDVLHLGSGLNVENTQLVRSGNDLLINWSNNASDKVTLQNYFYSSTYRIETIAFADGTQWALGDVAARLIQNGTAGNDYVSGLSEYANRINGLGGDDYVFGGAKEDLLNGGAGNDILSGQDGNDTLLGSTGNDMLSGGTGNDTYIFNLGDGADTLSDYDYLATNVDVLRLGPGLSVATAQLGRSGNDLWLSWNGNDNDKVTLQNYFYSSTYRIETIAFADGTQLNMPEVAARLIQNGTDRNDYITGLNDYANRINGLAGDDYLYGGTKDDVLDGGAGNDILYGQDGNDKLAGNTGNDMLYGGLGNDTYILNLGDGADTISDYDYTSGNIDVLRIGEGLSVATAQLGRSGNDLVLSWRGNANDKVTLQNYFNSSTYRIETIAFSDGTQFSLTDVAARLIQNGSAGNDYITGLTDYSNRINGLGGDDYLYGGAKDDVISGGAGKDVLNGGTGNDTYLFNLGDGADTLGDYDYTSGNVDVLRIGPGLSSATAQLGRSGNDLVLSWSGNDIDKVTLQNYFYSSTYRIETIAFTDGTQLALTDVAARLIQNGTAANEYISGLSDFANRINGLGGDDYLCGGTKDDVLNGGTGNDVLNGGSGNDTYIFNLGDGADTLGDYDYTSGNVDVLRIGSGLSSATAQLGRSGNDLVLSWSGNATDKVTLQSYFYSSTYRIETIAFADGTQFTMTEVAAKLTQNGTAGNDYITGLSDYANRINGLGGDDYLNGGTKDDVLNGGAGNDILNGGSGNDTYIFNLGDGADTLGDYDYANGNVDVLRIGSGLSASTAQLGRSGNDLVLSWSGNATDKVTLQSYFYSSTYRIETIAFTDGTKWSMTEVAAKLTQNGAAGNDYITGLNDYANRINGMGGDDYLYGGAKDDLLNGNAGNDLLSGQDGNDTLSGSTGNDMLNGGYGNDTYVFNLGDGTDTLSDYDYTSGNVDEARWDGSVSSQQLWFSRCGYDLQVSVIGTTDKVTMTNWYLGSQYQIEQFKSGDGKTILNTQVNALVSAMAQFAPPAAGQTTLPVNYQSAMSATLAANWK